MDTVYDYARGLATGIAPSSLASTKLQLYRDLHRRRGLVGHRCRPAVGADDDRPRLRRRGGRPDRAPSPELRRSAGAGCRRVAARRCDRAVTPSRRTPGAGDQQRPVLEQVAVAAPGRLAPLVPFVVPPGGSTSRAPGMRAATRSEVSRVWWASVVPLRKTRVGTSSSAHVVGQSGHGGPLVGAVGRHPPLQRVDERSGGRGRGTAAGSPGLRSITSLHSGEPTTASIPPLQAARIDSPQ